MTEGEALTNINNHKNVFTHVDVLGLLLLTVQQRIHMTKICELETYL